MAPEDAETAELVSLLGPLRLPRSDALAAAGEVRRALAKYQIRMQEPRPGYEKFGSLEIKRSQIRDEMLKPLESFLAAFDGGFFHHLDPDTQERVEAAISVLENELMPALEQEPDVKGSNETDPRQVDLAADLTDIWIRNGGNLSTSGAEGSNGGALVRFLHGAMVLVGIRRSTEGIRSRVRGSLG